MKYRFWLFAGDNHYPNGGMEDFKDSFDNLDEALKEANKLNSLTNFKLYDWYHIYDSENRKVLNV